MDGIRRRTWAQVDLDAAAYNYSAVKNAAGADVCCVIKANAYGHGAVQLGRLYARLGAGLLAVSNIEEALQLRRGGVMLPTLILGYTPPECAPVLSLNNVIQCVYSSDYAQALSAAAVAAGISVRVHIKLDTGMGRIGFIAGQSEGVENAKSVCSLPGLDVEGVFTHFAVADDGKDGDAFTREQFERFVSSCKKIGEAAGKKLCRHCSNSAAIFDHPEYALDMVRAGIVLYGLSPSEKLRRRLDLRPVMTLNTIVSHIKTISAGDTVSYGRTFTADGQKLIATVPIGYADGLLRSVGGRYDMLINGHLAPIAGRVCMDQTMLDVTGLDVTVGDVVTVFGGDGAVSADALAKAAGTINYEVVCAVGERVPRFFTRGGAVVEVSDHIYEG